MTDLETLLVSLQAEVDRLGAEMKDPETSEERKEWIRSYFKSLFMTLSPMVQPK